ncbi:MAG: DUF3079 domain-containing protein [Burkholderiaceae bacterium]|nr:DUF3079 domain-containing protein [Burkholderiaceae bacterium]
MVKKFPTRPAHPERICWGCDRYCPVDAMMCGNGSVATPHPSELFGDDWMSWGLDAAGSELEQQAGESLPGDNSGTP